MPDKQSIMQPVFETWLVQHDFSIGDVCDALMQTINVLAQTHATKAVLLGVNNESLTLQEAESREAAGEIELCTDGAHFAEDGTAFGIDTRVYHKVGDENPEGSSIGNFDDFMATLAGIMPGIGTLDPSHYEN